MRDIYSESADGLRSRNSSYYVEFLKELDKYAPSKPLSEKVRLFLKDCGVTEECMEKIANILRKVRKGSSCVQR